jgi:tRNA pseudouridine55 synthase
MSGPTSYDCIRALKRLYAGTGKKLHRIGHLGTLDPIAEGVLPVAIGAATRLIRFFRADKVYRAVIRLGIATDTDDIEGRVLESFDTGGLTESVILPVLEGFRGELEQVPPKYSAVSSNGVKAYKRARMGEDFELKAKKVVIHSAELLEWAPPDLVARFRVGPGTYIRSIARDLGKGLGAGGCIAALKRESDGPFEVKDAVRIENLEREGPAAMLLPVDFILEGWPKIVIASDESSAFSQGKTLEGVPVIEATDDGFFAVYDERGFIGIGKASPDGFLKAGRVLRTDN